MQLKFLCMSFTTLKKDMIFQPESSHDKGVKCSENEEATRLVFSHQDDNKELEFNSQFNKIIVNNLAKKVVAISFYYTIQLAHVRKEEWKAHG